ncbi:tryptophan synthase [Aspergillus novofumigatus IBT 16806]|uniref:Tryptophan synthase n=1 Tax=Aspergillus novofumigatus (strain IBT 16806) TaxID=1392255 RepID=A0A2I1C0C8_ASPN1|nr:tryptophan synthase [Aspergillus novofumigatus IBT 16806]PKX91086.1 tryptophan synthase [Aspergillus novofumigatus IBT 16806]
MKAIKRTFAHCKEENRPAFVTFVTAGFPTVEEAVDIILGLEAGRAGMQYMIYRSTDPFADGPTIQNANTVSLAYNVTIESTLGMIKEARKRGLRAPLLLMGYYNPLLSYGEERLLNDCRVAGVNGFIVGDPPPHEAVRFRSFCAKSGQELLCKLADSLVYVVSRMGVTGATGTLNAGLPQLLKRIKQAVGFGLSTRDHFLGVASTADGVVIGSQIFTTLAVAASGERVKAAEEYCARVCGRRNLKGRRMTQKVASNGAQEPNGDVQVNGNGTIYTNGNHSGPLDQKEAMNSEVGDPELFPARFGEFGGSYSPESLMGCLSELEAGFENIRNDPESWAEPGHLHVADRLTEHAGGATIWLKREELNHTGSHNINRALGQILLARYQGRPEIIAQTGAGMHGVATATVCAKFSMKCTIFMGADDVRRQAVNVFRIKLLGAAVIPVEAGSKTLRDAVNESFRVWITKVHAACHIIGSAIGPHPFPTIVRTFQTVIGEETKAQYAGQRNKLPGAVAACIGGGSNCLGMFYPFINDPSVQLLGVEAGGDGLETKRHAATLSGGTKGVLHGSRTYVLQDEHGQIQDTHSTSARLDYAGVGRVDLSWPELTSGKDSGRAEFVAVTDAQALEGFKLLSELEGISPALETAHGIWGAVEQAKTMKKGQDVVICVSGRGDKDVENVAEELPRHGPKIGWDLRF